MEFFDKGKELFKRGQQMLTSVDYPICSNSKDNLIIQLSPNYEIQYNNRIKMAELKCLPLDVVYATTRALHNKSASVRTEEIWDLCAVYNELSTAEFKATAQPIWKSEINHFCRELNKYL